MYNWHINFYLWSWHNINCYL